MNRNNEVNIFSVVCASILGTVIGVIVGLMLAPQSGNELRNDIVTNGRDFAKKVRTKKNDFFDELDDDIEEIGDFDADILGED